MALDAKVSVGDSTPQIQLITTPDPPEPAPAQASVATAAPEGESPTAQSADATIEQTGSGPPPEGR